MISKEVLRRYPYFAAADEETLAAIALAAQERSVKANERLFQEGDPSDQLFILKSGQVVITQELGDDQIAVVETLIAGDLLGWSAMIQPYLRRWDCGASRATELVVIDAATMRELCHTNTAFGFAFMEHLAGVLSSRLDGARIQLATAE